MRIATALKEKQERLFPKCIAMDKKMWRKVHSIKLPFQVDKQLYNQYEKKVDQFAVQRNGLGHTIGLVLLRQRARSPPPKVAPTTGTMEVSETLCALFQMQGSPMAAGGDAFGNSIRGFAVNPSASLAGTSGTAGNLMGGFVFNTNIQLQSGSSLAASIPKSYQDASMVGAQQKQAQSINVPTNVGDLERELAQVKHSLKEEREAALAKETQVDRLQRNFDQVNRCNEELNLKLTTQSNQLTFHEQQLNEHADQAESEVAALKRELLELQRKHNEEKQAKEQTNLQLQQCSERGKTLEEELKKKLAELEKRHAVLLEQVNAQSSERRSNAVSNENSELNKSLLAKFVIKKQSLHKRTRKFQILKDNAILINCISPIFVPSTMSALTEYQRVAIFSRACKGRLGKLKPKGK